MTKEIDFSKPPFYKTMGRSRVEGSEVAMRSARSRGISAAIVGAGYSVSELATLYSVRKMIQFEYKLNALSHNEWMLRTGLRYEEEVSDTVSFLQDYGVDIEFEPTLFEYGFDFDTLPGTCSSEEELDQEQMRGYVDRYLNKFVGYAYSQRNLDILKMYYLEDFTLDGVASRFNVTRERVRQVVADTCDRIRVANAGGGGMRRFKSTFNDHLPLDVSEHFPHPSITMESMSHDILNLTNVYREGAVTIKELIDDPANLSLIMTGVAPYLDDESWLYLYSKHKEKILSGDW